MNVALTRKVARCGLLGIVVLCFATTAEVSAGSPPESPTAAPFRSGVAAGPVQLPGPAAPNVVLYDQYDNDGSDGIASTLRSDDASFTGEAADDFVVPAGQTWVITGIDVREYVGFHTADSFNVRFFADAGGLPGAQVTGRSFLAYSGNPDLTIPLSRSVVLNPGTYWISVQANASTNWYWEMRSVQSGSPAAWREGGGYGTGCTSWSNRGTCTGTSSTPDQMFRLNGTAHSYSPLHDQYDNRSNTYVISTKNPSDPSLESMIADDFVVPSNQSWTISRIDLEEDFLTHNAATFNVAFYKDGAGNFPDVLVTSQSDLPYGGLGDLTIPLASTVTLLPGTYWVSVQANAGSAVWLWRMRTVQTHSGAAWKEGGGFGSGCTNWGRVTTCTSSTPPDTVFRLHGTIGAATATAVTSLAARGARGGVAVTWRGTGAPDTLGFNVWRASGSKWMKLNARLIPARSGPSKYRYVDRSIRRDGRYAYRIEAVRFDGRVDRLGPVTVVVR